MINASSAKNWDTLHIIAQIKDVLIAMSMDIEQQIAQTGYRHQAHLHIIRDIILMQGITLDLLLDIVTGIGTGITGPDTSHILADIKVTVIITHTEAAPESYHRHPHRNTSHHHHTGTYCYHCNTPHRRSSSHRSSSFHSRDCSRSRTCTSYKPSKTTSSKPLPSSSRTTVKHQNKKHKKVIIDDPQSNYYSSDDTSSDSEDNLN